MVNYSDGAIRRLWIRGMLRMFSNGILEFFDGVQPASANLEPTGNLLLSMPLPEEPFKEVNLSTVDLSAPLVSSIGSVVQAGVPTWARIRLAEDPNLEDTTATYPRVDCSVGTSSSSEMVVNSAEFTVLTILTVLHFIVANSHNYDLD